MAEWISIGINRRPMSEIVNDASQWSTCQTQTHTMHCKF